LIAVRPAVGLQTMSILSLRVLAVSPTGENRSAGTGSLSEAAGEASNATSSGRDIEFKGLCGVQQFAGLMALATCQGGWLPSLLSPKRRQIEMLLNWKRRRIFNLI
jgi:hypothetical protein